MKQFYPLLPILTVSLFSIPAYSQTQSIYETRTLSFEEALIQTIGYNQLIKQATAHINQKKQEEKAAKALYLPQISVGANYVFMSEDIHIDLTPVRDAITPLYDALGSYGNFSGVPNPDPSSSGVMPTLPDNIATAAVREELIKGLDKINSAEWDMTIQKQQFAVLSTNFTQPLFMGGKIILANQAAKLKVEEAEIQKSEAYNQIYSELVERYYALVLSKHAKKVRQQVYNTMSEHLSNAEKMKSEGIIANAEYLHAKVYFAEAERELSKANRQVEIVNQSLLNTLAIDTLVAIEPISSLFYLENPEPLSFYLQNARLYSPLLKQIEKKIELANTAYQAQKTEYLPKIAVMGTYDIANKDLSSHIPEYALGVGLKWNIFQGTSRPHKIKAAKYQVEQAENFSAKTNSAIKTAITRYYQETQMHLEQLHKLESEMQFAEEYSRVKNTAFREGMATSTEVTDANLQMAKVKSEQYKAGYEYDVALSRLLYYSGLIESFTAQQALSHTKFLN